MSDLNNTASIGDRVTVQFKATLEDGTLIDECDQTNPLEFIIGNHTVIPGLEQTANGMQVGDSKNVVILPENGFGIYQKDLIFDWNKQDLPDNLKFAPGERIETTLKDGSKYRLTVLKVEEDTVTMDANHTFAGKNILLDLKLINIQKGKING